MTPSIECKRSKNLLMPEGDKRLALSEILYFLSGLPGFIDITSPDTAAW
jgi:hypothetical protein